MEKEYVAELREACRVAFCQDWGLPLSTTSEEISSQFSNEWLPYRAGFISGCQFQLGKASQVLDKICAAAEIQQLISEHASLPDGP